MKTCIFICKKRHDYFNLQKIYDPRKFRFICIIPEKNLNSIPKYCRPYFEKIIMVTEITEETIGRIIRQEIDEHDNNVSLLCLDELDVLAVASIRDRYEIRGGKLSDYVPFRNKIIMKSKLLMHNIRVPSFLSFEYLDILPIEALYKKIVACCGNKFIVKPIQGASSINTIKIEAYHDFYQWRKKLNDRLESYQAEEYIEGRLFHCDSFVRKGTILFSEVSECLTNCLDYANGNSSDGGIVLPQDFKLRNLLLDFNKKVLNVLIPPDGAIHHEIFVKKNEEIIFLEIAARPGGGEIVKILERNYGINLYEQTLLNELNEQMNFNQIKNLYHAWVYLALPIGKIKKINYPKLVSQTSIEWKVALGDEIVNQQTSVLRQEAARINLYHPDFNVIYKDFNYLKTFNAVEVETN